MLSLETVLVLPILAMIIVALLHLASLLADVLIVHEAARAGVRAAVTTTDDRQVIAHARAAAPELPDLAIEVSPSPRSSGDVVRVDVLAQRMFGPVSYPVRAAGIATVEPGVG